MKKYLILLVIFIPLFGCKTAKINWVKENFEEKSVVSQKLETQKDSLISEINKVSATIQEQLTIITTTTGSSSTVNLDESTTITGTLTAEDGKEKSVTAGGITIKSNGANVSFETTMTRRETIELQHKVESLTVQLNEAISKIEQNQLKTISNEKQLADFRSTYESQSRTKDKEVKKTGFQAGVWIIGGLAILVLVVLLYLTWKFDWIKKAKNIFNKTTGPII